MTDPKLIVLPFTHGVVTFATAEFVSIEGEERFDIKREQIVGRQPEKHETVIVLDLEDLRAALRGASAKVKA